MKLFIHEILPDSVRKSIYVDTDAFFISMLALPTFTGFITVNNVPLPS